MIGGTRGGYCHKSKSEGGREILRSQEGTIVQVVLGLKTTRNEMGTMKATAKFLLPLNHSRHLFLITATHPTHTKFVESFTGYLP